MLPPGLHPLAEIEQERSPETQLTQLVQLLSYLLNKINPNLTPKDGKKVGHGERVDANRHLFTNVADVFFALGVRNCIVHPEDCEKPPTEAEIKRAGAHLRNAVHEIRDHYRIPADIRRTIFQPAAPPPSGQVNQAPPRPAEPPIPPPPNFQNVHQVNQVKPINPPPEPRLAVPTPRPAHSPRLKHPVRWAVLLIAAVTLLAYSRTLWQWGYGVAYGSRSEAQDTRRAAEAALKRVQGFDQQQGFAARITAAQAAWRDANLAFNQERFKEAITGYQRVMQLADELTAQNYARTEAQKLLAEIQNDRQAARAAQAPQSATQLWQEAETARRAAATAFNNGNFAEAKQQALLARQKYEEVRGVINPTPSPTPTATVETTPSPTAPPTPEPSATLRPPDPTPTATPRPTPTATPPPDEPEEDDIFFIGQREFMYYVKKQVAPTLPPEARAQGIAGPVEIEVVLGKDGRLMERQTRVLSGHALLRQAALDALRQWQFKPYQQDRVPIDVRSEITINVR